MYLFILKIKEKIKAFINRFRRTSVRAVYDADIEKLTESLGINSGIKNGECKCKYCNATISFENLHALLKENGEIKLICSDIKCQTNLS